jgi:hypothetical protein
MSSEAAVVAGRYELRERLGSGGVADVYRAVDRSLGRAVAVKLFRPGCGPELGGRRFAAEVWTLACLQHSNLVTLYDAGTDEGRGFLVLQLIRGPTLADRLREGPLPPGAVARLGAALAEALACAHDHAIAHRDVKPSNVLLDRDGGVYLTDFGIACLLGAAGLTATGTLVGTAAYLAPEQVAGEAVGAASDVYALGLVLLECLTGRREYVGSVAEMAVARLHRPPRLPAGLGPGWRALLTALTTREPWRRPPARQVAARLRRLAEDVAPAPAARPAPARQPRPQLGDSGPPTVAADYGQTSRPGHRGARWRATAGTAACLAVLAVAAPATVRHLADGGRDAPGATADQGTGRPHPTGTPRAGAPPGGAGSGLGAAGAPDHVQPTAPTGDAVSGSSHAGRGAGDEPPGKQKAHGDRAGKGNKGKGKGKPKQ